MSNVRNSGKSNRPAHRKPKKRQPIPGAIYNGMTRGYRHKDSKTNKYRIDEAGYRHDRKIGARLDLEVAPPIGYTESVMRGKAYGEIVADTSYSRPGLDYVGEESPLLREPPIPSMRVRSIFIGCYLMFVIVLIGAIYLVLSRN